MFYAHCFCFQHLLEILNLMASLSRLHCIVSVYRLEVDSHPLKVLLHKSYALEERPTEYKCSYISAM